ncbi:3-hydroxyacyl-CoA dehydrogenase [Halococcus salifodinae DSM 8989]|uniref:3-hydroxyacyl-CoA dehydrogenase n=2 Tax=Halococcaceae TaxID=1963270 RepID=M0NGW6_9EURY|nr:3-hydroxyacyl-CoA dehydrogenase [Halococcus salifodinae DSM 8989]
MSVFRDSLTSGDGVNSVPGGFVCMDASEIERVAVLGAGNMGHGITEVVAIAGYDVTMRDVEEEFVDSGYEDIEWSLDKLDEKGRIDESADDVLDRIDITTDLETAVGDVDLVIEAAPERMALKQEIYGELDDFTPDDAILASNTSSLSITEIATAVDDPERVVGTHFFNPPVKMDLVEVIYGERTSDETAEAAHAFVESLDKTPIYVRKDVQGFVVNSVLGPFMVEPAWMVSNSEATIQEADAAMVHQRGYPMGPFELGDLTGIDIGYSVREEAGIENPPLIEEKVEAEELGRKTGKGYYDYEEGEGADYEPGDGEGFDTLRVEAQMVNEAAKLIGQDVATPEAIDTGMRLGAGFPEGPCRRADDIGLDRIIEKLEALHDETGEERFAPADYLVELGESGKTGADAGQGFYSHGDGDERTYHDLNYEIDDRGVLAIELDRPERLNALSQDLLEEIDHLLSTTDPDELRCVTIEGTGERAFSAGADVTGFADTEPADVLRATPTYETVAEFPRPVIAKIEGFCLGGGHELALACDMRIATEGSKFGQPEIGLGLIPGGGATQRLTRLVGAARAKELVFRGHQIDAATAADWGMINRAVPANELDNAMEEVLADIVNGPPVGLEVAKKVMNEGADADLDAALTLERQGFSILMGTDDVAEGTAAFREDRDPEFEGR